MMPRLPLYVYSNRNIAGSLLALAAVGAYLAGAIHDYWYFIAAGAYGIGALAAPRSPQLESSLSEEMNAEDIVAGLGRLARDAQRRLPPDIAALVSSICTTIAGIMPAIRRMSATNQDVFDITRTATTYLPQTLQHFLALPPAYRNYQVVENGKTPRQLLIDQLTLLDAKAKEMAANVLANDTTALIENGRFLQQKFAAPAFETHT